MKDNTLAAFFYEQCAGVTRGHMAPIPNNPMLFGLVQAATGTRDDSYAASQTDFVKLLREIADQLDRDSNGRALHAGSKCFGE